MDLIWQLNYSASNELYKWLWYYGDENCEASACLSAPFSSLRAPTPTLDCSKLCSATYIPFLSRKARLGSFLPDMKSDLATFQDRPQFHPQFQPQYLFKSPQSPR